MANKSKSSKRSRQEPSPGGASGAGDVNTGVPAGDVYAGTATSQEASDASASKARTATIHPVVKYGAPVLEQPTRPIEQFDESLAQLCEEMFQSMYAANGVGLAAPQIGIGKRLAVVDVSVGKNPEAKIVLANPEIIRFDGEQREEEGCLSIPGFRGNVARPLYVTVRAQDITGKTFEINGEGLLARAFCHETDHLDGILFIRHLSLLKRDLIRRRIRKLQKAGDW